MTRIHYICINQNCCADVYRDNRDDYLVNCDVCHKQWAPSNFSFGSWAHGKEEKTQ